MVTALISRGGGNEAVQFKTRGARRDDRERRSHAFCVRSVTRRGGIGRGMIDNVKDHFYGTAQTIDFQTMRECPYLWTFLFQIYDLRIPRMQGRDCGVYDLVVTC